MMMNTIRKLGAALGAIVLAATGINLPVQADDTEIFQASYGSGTSGRPKVLIIFDNSGSMRTEVTTGRPNYDPNATYANSNAIANKIYWSTGGTPPSTGSNRYFSADKNRCAESFTPLLTEGKTEVNAKQWRNSAWRNLRTSQRNPEHVDCDADVINSNPSNGPGQTDGYPANGPAYVTNVNDPAVNNNNWRAYTFYTKHYMDWRNDASLVTSRTRLEIAQEVVSGLISSSPAVDFGLAAFNFNGSGGSNDGGRILSSLINNMTTAQRANVVDIVNDDLTASTWTPLCETSYEAYRYLAGLTPYYANEAGGSSPAADASAISGGKYVSPATDCAVTYVILMTDGEPTYDTDANTRIEALTQQTCSNYADGSGGTNKNCLPELAAYMSSTDLDNDDTNGNQYAITYTIGFDTDQTLLSDVAAAGKGAYHTAATADELADAFSATLLSILETDATFTSPAVAVDTFTRTQSRNDVFFAMFTPSNQVNWPGNIKKLRLSITNGIANFVDKTGDNAIDPDSGLISAGADTYWLVGSDADGPEVEKGGVGALLEARTPSSRVLFTNTGTSGALETFNIANIDAAAYNFTATSPDTPDSLLLDLWDAADQAELNEIINWAIGYSVADDASLIDTAHGWLLADMLHSKPLVVNYGALGPFTDADPDLRIVVGTNGGFLHMFGNNNGEEDWAFFAKELAPIVNARKQNLVTNDHPYGIDATPTVWTYDSDFDGTIDHNKGDKAFLYVGLRRGGRIYYALDISNPNSPSFKWTIDENTTGFSELGQTWSIPKQAKIPGYDDPVLIFGAGYDTNKDGTGLASTDSMGRGIFIVDADTGALVWSVTPGANSATNLNAPIDHSVPATITLLDSNGDALTDRLYFGDTGGNLWRVDLMGNARPSSAQDTWKITKVADLNGGTVATDRRIFNAVDVVSTRYKGLPFDALLFGSGDRTNPNGTDVDNRFYMLRDEKVSPYTSAAPTTADCGLPDPVDDFRCILPITDIGTGSLPQIEGTLYDATDNLIQVGTTDQKVDAAIALAASNGWFIDLEANGEKALARSLTIQGEVFFTTFSPAANESNACGPSPGIGLLYAVDLQTAAAIKNFDNDIDVERSGEIGDLIPDTPSPHIDPDGDIRLLLPPGSTDIDNPFDSGSSLPTPYGSYWYQEDY
jgi:type IV pilus assembly protein PilY1